MSSSHCCGNAISNTPINCVNDRFLISDKCGRTSKKKIVCAVVTTIQENDKVLVCNEANELVKRDAPSPSALFNPHPVSTVWSAFPIIGDPTVVPMTGATGGWIAVGFIDNTVWDAVAGTYTIPVDGFYEIIINAYIEAPESPGNSIFQESTVIRLDGALQVRYGFPGNQDQISATDTNDCYGGNGIFQATQGQVFTFELSGVAGQITTGGHDIFVTIKRIG